MSSSDPTKSTERTGGFSLSSLVLLVTAIVVFLTAIDIHSCREQIGRLWAREHLTLVFLFLGAATIGAIIGFARLFVDGFSWRMLLLSPFVGCLVGAVAVLILLAPGPIGRTLFAIGLLLAATNVMRLGVD